MTVILALACLLASSGLVQARTYHAKIPSQHGPWQVCDVMISTATDANKPKLKLLGVPVARNPVQRAAGLRDHQGPVPALMLFQWSRLIRPNLWMYNVDHPLAVGFITQQKRLIGIQQMQPQTRTRHSSPIPVRLALETEPEILADVQSENSKVEITHCRLDEDSS